MTVLSTQVGRLGDMFGRVRMYEVGFGVFVLGSLLCALATGEATIIGFRVAPGRRRRADQRQQRRRDRRHRSRRSGGGGPTATPRVGWSAGAVLGILLGGLITTYVSWRWIFGINVPIGIAAIVLALRVLRDRGERHSASRGRAPAWCSSAADSSVCCGPSPVWPPARSMRPCSATSSSARSCWSPSWPSSAARPSPCSTFRSLACPP